MGSGEERKRIRDLGITVGRLRTGKWNAITDVSGVKVGHTTLISGEGALKVGKGPVRTGVTAVLPHGGDLATDPLFAGYHILNGNGEMTGLPWIHESGLLMSQIAITNTHSTGVVRDAMIAYNHSKGRDRLGYGLSSLPVVGETFDGYLSDIDGMHVKEEHVFEAFESAESGPVAEGCVGGGTGMICHQFKGGIGTSSRVLTERNGGWTVGVLVQANHGKRELFKVNGVPVGMEIDADEVPLPWTPPLPGAGSIIVIIATDAPLLPHQCRRLAQRATLGIARLGGLGENGSGDIFFAFSTANRGMNDQLATPGISSVMMISCEAMNPLFEAVAEATEEAILNALCMATTMTGIDDKTVYALPLGRLKKIMKKYNRL